MRKVMVFGESGALTPKFSEQLREHGLELSAYKKGVPASKGKIETPVIVVSGNVKEADEKPLKEFLALLSGMPYVYIPGDGRVSPVISRVRRGARFILRKDWLDTELLRAVDACAEIIGMKESLDRLRGELDEKTLELTYMLDIGKSLASSFELPTLLETIMERLCIISGASGWAVLLLDEAEQELKLESAKMPRGRKAKGIRLKIGQGIAGWAARDREPKVVRDALSDKRFIKMADRLPGVVSLMAVPILIKDKLLGVIELYNKKGGGSFDDADLGLVGRLLDQMAIAIERANIYQKMADLVITDDLTKLFNLRYLERSLDVEIERAMRYNLAVSLIFMDIDFFKKVNDRYGHLTGSKLLVELSQLLLKSLRKVDIVARYGGDEFVMVLPQTDIDAAKAIAERLRRNIEKNMFLKEEGLSLKITASFGIASYPTHAVNKEELIRLADEAMYRVKHDTRNGVYVME